MTPLEAATCPKPVPGAFTVRGRALFGYAARSLDDELPHPLGAPGGRALGPGVGRPTPLHHPIASQTITLGGVPQLRLALNQIDSTRRRHRRQRRLGPPLDPALRRAGSAPRGVPGDGADRVPRRGPGPALLLRGGVPRGPALARHAPRRRGLRRAAGGRRLPRPVRERPAEVRPPGRLPAQRRARCCTAARWSLTFAKHHLPNYGVFDEFRYFVPGDTMPVLRVHGVDVALAICEDLWQDGGRVPAARSAGAGPAALDQRLAVRARQGRHPPGAGPQARPGGRLHDRLPGDGRRPGRAGLRRRLDRRRQGRRSDRPGPAVRGGLRGPGPGPAGRRRRTPPRAWSTTGCASTTWCSPRSRCPRTSRSWRAATRSAWTTTRRCTRRWSWACARTSRRTASASVLIGLSGGIDSALVAAIACDALGARERVRRLDAVEVLLRPLQGRRGGTGPADGLNFRTVPIAPMFDAYMGSLDLTGLAEENLQSRLRGTMLMAHLQPGGSHRAGAGQQVGAGGGLLDAVRRLGGRVRPDQGRVQDVDLPPGRSGATARPRNAGQTPPIPENSITKPPSAELRPGQVDTDSLPDYRRAGRDPRAVRGPGLRARTRSWRPGTTRNW